MRETLVLGIALVFSLLLPQNIASADIWAKGVSQTGGWFDAEKDNQPPWDDTMMCWAASAANMLMWSGWNAGYANEDQIFDFLVAQDPVNGGSLQYDALRFWFDGSQGPAVHGHFLGSSHPGYYSTEQFNASYVDYFGDPDVMGRSASLLQAGYGVGLRLNGPHAITLWGIKTDPTGAYQGVWVTDSDNNANGPDPRPDTLDYYDVLEMSGEWFMLGYGAGYIQDVQALLALQVPDVLPLPLPPAAWLGLFGFGTAGWRLRKHA